MLHRSYKLQVNIYIVQVNGYIHIKIIANGI